MPAGPTVVAVAVVSCLGRTAAGVATGSAHATASAALRRRIEERILLENWRKILKQKIG